MKKVNHTEESWRKRELVGTKYMRWCLGHCRDLVPGLWMLTLPWDRMCNRHHSPVYPWMLFFPDRSLSTLRVSWRRDSLSLWHMSLSVTLGRKPIALFPSKMERGWWVSFHDHILHLFYVYPSTESNNHNHSVGEYFCPCIRERGRKDLECFKNLSKWQRQDLGSNRLPPAQPCSPPQYILCMEFRFSFEPLRRGRRAERAVIAQEAKRTRHSKAIYVRH